MMRRLLALSAVTGATWIGAPRAAAQTVDTRLARLDSATRATVVAIIDSARGAGLPTEPLTLKALEGASKGADDARIVAAVRSLAGEMRAARAALGDAARADEISAAAAALHVGASPTELARLRTTRPGASLAVPLAVLSDLIARGVPADTASAIIAQLAAGGVRDDGFLALRAGVERDIVAGESPTDAAARRARSVAPGGFRPSPASERPPP